MFNVACIAQHESQIVRHNDNIMQQWLFDNDMIKKRGHPPSKTKWYVRYIT